MGSDGEQIGPRIYNLFPRLVGSVDKWDVHLYRAVEMEFNWIYVNPINYTGFSGSLYSIKDYFKFNSMFAPEGSADPHSWEPLKKFIAECHAHKMRFMLDLVINHTAIDSPLVEEHPDWYKERIGVIDRSTHQVIRYYELDEKIPVHEYPDDQYEIRRKISNPYAIDPADARKVTIWGDLAELDSGNSPKKTEIQDYWKKLLQFYLDMGVDGFRCDAAYQVPSEMWRILINYVKEKAPKTIFLAETLGCTLKQCELLSDAGFDYIHSSSKWWDFTQSWAIEQYEEFRHLAPSVSFPESHDTKRLALETNDRQDVQIFRYAFAAFFSKGVLMPIGYEYGFHRKLDVVDMMPNEWEEKHMDISSNIKEINKFKTQIRALNEDGRIIHWSYPNLGILVIKKTSLDGKQSILLIYNKDWNNNNFISINFSDLFKNKQDPIYRIQLSGERKLVTFEKFEADLRPNEFMFFIQGE
jgi:starch synthase (maltosyl-transferring)